MSQIPHPRTPESLPPLDSKNAATKLSRRAMSFNVTPVSTEIFLHWLHWWLHFVFLGAWSSLHLSEDQFSLEFVPTIPYNMPGASSRQFGQCSPSSPLVGPTPTGFILNGWREGGMNVYGWMYGWTNLWRLSHPSPLQLDRPFLSDI